MFVTGLVVLCSEQSYVIIDIRPVSDDMYFFLFKIKL